MPFKKSTADVLSSGFASLRGHADSVITDSARRAAYQSLCRQLESELLEFEQYAAGHGQRYRAAFVDYSLQPAELRNLSEEFRRRQFAMQDRFVEIHLAMAGTVSAQEWQALAPHEAKIIDSLVGAAVGKKR